MYEKLRKRELLKKIEAKRLSFGMSKAEIIEKMGYTGDDFEKFLSNYDNYLTELKGLEYNTLKSMCEAVELDFENLVKDMIESEKTKFLSKNMNQFLNYLAQRKHELTMSLEIYNETGQLSIYETEATITNQLNSLQDAINHLPHSEKELVDKIFTEYKENTVWD